MGDRVKCVVTGFSGIVMAHVVYAFGCAQVGIQREKLMDDGKVMSLRYVDIYQVRIVKRGVLNPHSSVVPAGDPGGPQQSPPSR